MIYLKSLYNKNIWKYFFIFLILFSLSLMLLNIYKCYKLAVIKELKKTEYRTIMVNFNDECNIEETLSLYQDKIEKIEEDNIIFKTREDLEAFATQNSSCFSKSIILTTNIDNYIYIRNILFILFSVIMILIIILISVFSLNMLYDIKKDIALYKLIGYKLKNIMKKILEFYGLFYFFVYILSIILVNSILKFGSFASLSNYLKLDNLNLLSINNYLEVGLVIILMLVAVLKRLSKVIKVSKPIELIKS